MINVIIIERQDYNETGWKGKCAKTEMTNSADELMKQAQTINAARRPHYWIFRKVGCCLLVRAILLSDILRRLHWSCNSKPEFFFREKSIQDAGINEEVKRNSGDTQRKRQSYKTRGEPGSPEQYAEYARDKNGHVQQRNDHDEIKKPAVMGSFEPDIQLPTLPLD